MKEENKDAVMLRMIFAKYNLAIEYCSEDDGSLAIDYTKKAVEEFKEYLKATDDLVEVIKDYVELLSLLDIKATKGHLCEDIETIKYRLMVESYNFYEGKVFKDKILALYKKYYNPKYKEYLNKKGESK